MPEKLEHVKPSKARVALWLATKPAFWPDLVRRTKLNIANALLPAPMSDDIADNTAFRDFAAEVEVEPVIVFSEGSGLSGARFVGLLRKAI